MSEIITEQEIVDAPKETDPLAELFEERDRPKDVDPPKEKEAKVAPPKKEAPTETVAKEKDDDEDDTPIPSSEIDKTKEELGKVQKRLSENQKYARQNAQKVKNALEIVKGLIESGDVMEEDAGSLLNALQLDGDAGEEEYYKGSSHPFAPIFAIANKELENIRKYTEDDSLQDKVAAFDYFLSIATPDEIEETRDELMELSDDPIKLTKKMLSIGQKAYEDSYKDLKESGNFKNYKVKKQNEIDLLKKSIDKLTKKLSKYETYDKPTYRLEEVADVDSKESESQDPLTEMFKRRDSIRR